MPQLRLERGAPVANPEGTLPARAGRSYGKLKPGPGKSAEDVARYQRARVRSAMTEILAEQSYEEITLRMLARRAGISTRTFYQCYSGKEESFLELHEQMTRSLLMAMDLSQANAESSDERMERAVEAIWHELRDPVTAQLMLVDVNVVGPRAWSQASRTQRSLEARMSIFADDDLTGSRMSHRVIEGVLSGVIGLARSRLVAEGSTTSLISYEEISSWALACIAQPMAGLREIDREIGDKVGMRPFRLPVDGEAALLLNAAAKLAAAEDLSALNTRSLLDAAGLPPRALAANFQSLEDCVVAARDTLIREAIGRAGQVALENASPARRVARFVMAFCEELERDPVLSGFCFGRLAKSQIYKMAHQVSIQAFMAGLLDLALKPLPALVVNRTHSEASIAACWGLLEDRVATHGSTLVSDLSPALAYLVLAPVIGPAEAVETVQMEYDFVTQPGRSV